MLLFQALIVGMAAGSIYALIALGLVLIYKSSGVINFAQGGLVMIGAFIAYTVLIKTGIPLWAAFPIILVLAGLLGVVIEKLVLRHMTGVSLISVIMVTLGINFVIEGSATAVWGTSNFSFPKIFPSISLNLGGIMISEVYLCGFSIAIVILVIFLLFFKYSKMGLAMRAVADNQKASVSLGLSPSKIFSLSWALSCIVATIGGIVLANIKLLNVGLGYIGLVVFPVVILGGLDSIAGAVIGGFIIGLLESISGVYISRLIGGAVEQVISFVVLLIILLVRPYGLFGTKEILRL